MSRIASVSIFFAIISGFLYIANLAAYEALALMFGMAAPVSLLLLASVLGFFSSSFIIATILGNVYYTWFTRIYYKVSAVYIGFFCYLFFACVLYALMVGISGQALEMVGMVLVGSAVAVSLYGFFHAQKIYVKTIPLSLPNLPTAWKGKKVVWISDVHLGQLHGPAFAHKVVERVNALSPDIVFIGGDLFDGTGAPDIPELLAPFAKLSALRQTYFITGNHEEFGSSETFISAIRAVGMRTLIDEMVVIDGVQLIGVDYKHASKKESFQEILSGLSLTSEMPSILLKHEPKDLEIAEEAGISLQISGHTHQAQMWPLVYIARMVYKGHEYGLTHLENMQVYTSSGIGTWGPPMRVGTDSEVVVFGF